MSTSSIAVIHVVSSAAAPPITLRLIVYALAAGAVVLFPSLWYLFRVFRGGRPAH